MTKSRMLT